MIKNVREGVFETNSSSMHSLAIVGSNRMTKEGLTPVVIDTGDPIIGEQELIIVRPDEYGWGGPRLISPLEKLSYIVTMIQYQDNAPTAESHYFRWLSEMVKDYVGYGLHYQPSGDWDPDGYIDHQSTDTLDEYWSKNEDEFKSNMRDIVFNQKYFIIIDNDNH